LLILIAVKNPDRVDLKINNQQSRTVRAAESFPMQKAGPQPAFTCTRKTATIS
jgi:hypothetical protein